MPSAINATWNTNPSQDRLNRLTWHGWVRMGEPFKNDRPRISARDFVVLFEKASGHSIAELAPPLRTADLTEGRIELTSLAVIRFALRSSDLATLLHKNPVSLTRWLNLGLVRERDVPEFLVRINSLDCEITAAARQLFLTKR